VYQLGGCVDEDISYVDEKGSRVFIPGITISKTQQMMCNAYVAGVILNTEGTNGTVSLKQPQGVFFYKDTQSSIPIPNVLVGGRMVSFEGGINSVVYIIPKVDEQSQQIDNLGAMIYLSPRTFNSLMGRLYILGDPYKEYPLLTEAHFEEDPAVKYFKQYTGGTLNEFIYYQGIRAPLKIWKVDYSEEIPTHSEFLDFNFTFGGADTYFR
jgi:hypothetical protein